MRDQREDLVEMVVPVTQFAPGVLHQQDHPRVAAKLVNGLEDLDEDLLRHVLGFVLAGEHAQHEPEYAVAVELDELVERPLVTGDVAFDEPLLVGIGFGHVSPTGGR